jgi:hypothetical protein
MIVIAGEPTMAGTTQTIRRLSAIAGASVSVAYTRFARRFLNYPVPGLDQYGNSTDKLEKIASVLRYSTGQERDPLYRDLASLVREAPPVFEHPFQKPSLGGVDSMVGDLLVVDNFYDDPYAVRDYALGLEYDRYGNNWFSSALEVLPSRFNGGKGTRLATEAIKRKLEAVTKSRVDDDTWDTGGDGWNGAFHYKTWTPLPNVGLVHNHVGRPEDVNFGWSGLIYLSPDSPPNSGTTIWRDKRTGLCYTHRAFYERDSRHCDPVIHIENRFNRLVLFFASVLHRSEEG